VTDRQTEEQRGRVTDRQTDRRTERKSDRQAGRRTERKSDRQAGRQKNGEKCGKWVRERLRKRKYERKRML